MSDEYEVFITRNPWILRIFGRYRFEIEIRLRRGIRVTGKGGSVALAWSCASLMASAAGVSIASECPFDERGRVLREDA